MEICRSGDGFIHFVLLWLQQPIWVGYLGFIKILSLKTPSLYCRDITSKVGDIVQLRAIMLHEQSHCGVYNYMCGYSS